MLEETITLVAVGPFTAKGFQKPVVAYSVLGVKGGPRLDQAA